MPILNKPLVVLLLALSSAGAQSVAIPPGCVLVDDMVVPAEMLHAESGFSGTAWPSGVVPYDFAPSVSAFDRERTRTALAEIMAVAAVRFVPRTGESAWITFQNSNGNNSYLGMSGGNQVINLYNWNVRYIICHEVLHALGFIHEHQRPDRDSFVTINWASISAGSAPQFGLSSAVLPTPYDFLSIMHYGAYAFSSGGPSITCQPAYSQFQNQIGNLNYLSAGDAAGLASRYGPPAAPRILALSTSSVPVQSSGFTLTITGERFTEGDVNPLGTPPSRVLWNGSPVPTTYVPATGQLTASISSARLTSAQCVTLSVENPLPGGGTSASVSFSVGAASCPSLAEFALNSAEAALTVDGRNLVSAYGPPLVVRKVPTAATTLAFQSTLALNLGETVLSLSLPVPASGAGLITPGYQAVNVDLSAPGLAFLNGGPASPLFLPTAAWSLSFAAPPPPFELTAQTIVLDASLQDGFRLSQAAAFEVPLFDPCTVGPALALGDDTFSMQPLGFQFPWYGTTHSQVYVGSNGYVTFLAGSTQKTPTAVGLRSLPPAIAALYADLDPTAGGTITFASDQVSRFGVCFTAVPLVGSPTPATFSLLADAGLRVTCNYSSVGSAPIIIGLAPGFGSGTLRPYDLSAGPHSIPGGSIPYEVFTPGSFDLSNSSAIFNLTPTGNPTAIP